MRVVVDAEGFNEERERYALRFCCEDCAHFVAERCAHFWPTTAHRRARYEAPFAADERLEVVFCKEFELR